MIRFTLLLAVCAFAFASSYASEPTYSTQPIETRARYSSGPIPPTGRKAEAQTDDFDDGDDVEERKYGFKRCKPGQICPDGRSLAHSDDVEARRNVHTIHPPGHRKAETETDDEDVEGRKFKRCPPGQICPDGRSLADSDVDAESDASEPTYSTQPIEKRRRVRPTYSSGPINTRAEDDDDDDDTEARKVRFTGPKYANHVEARATIPPSDRNVEARRFGKSCPPGQICPDGRSLAPSDDVEARRNVRTIQPPGHRKAETETDDEDVEGRKFKRCPPGQICPDGRSLADSDDVEARRNVRTIQPPGHRKAETETDDEDVEGRKFKRCPPGQICPDGRSLANSDVDVENVETRRYHVEICHPGQTCPGK